MAPRGGAVRVDSPTATARNSKDRAVRGCMLMKPGKSARRVSTWSPQPVSATTPISAQARARLRERRRRRRAAGSGETMAVASADKIISGARSIHASERRPFG